MDPVKDRSARHLRSLIGRRLCSDPPPTILSVLDAVDHLAPVEGESAVVSAVLVGAAFSSVVVCGSLLAVRTEIASMSWRRWRESQPDFVRTAIDSGFDLGPVFSAEPFPGVRIVRRIIDGHRWRDVVDDLSRGVLHTPFERASLHASRWSSTVLLGTTGHSDAHSVAYSVRRPVVAVASELVAPAVPHTDQTWSWPLPPGLRPGPTLGGMAPRRRLLHWPQALLGIDWIADPKHPPINVFVVGRAIEDAWMHRVRPEYETEQLAISLGWDADLIDPLGCSLVVRADKDGLPTLERHIRVSDLPPGPMTDGVVEPRELGTRKRTLEIHVPRGPRRTDWRVALYAPDGRLLDEVPAVRRFEAASLTFSFGAGDPGHHTTVGDTKPMPSTDEQDAAVVQAMTVERQARDAAAARRISSTSQLIDYIRIRLACRSGELLIADPWLLGNDPSVAIAILARLRRNVRGLSGGLPPTAHPLLAREASWLSIKSLGQGRKALHDRVWLVGETGLLVGNSVSDLAGSPTVPRRTSTITELGHADAAQWRQQFETWWSHARA